MTKRLHTFFAIICGVFLTSYAMASTHLPTPAPSTQNLDSVVAVVNQEIITQSELNKSLVNARQELAASANPNAVNDAQLQHMVLQQLIDQKLQLQLAKQADITVSDAEVTKAIERIAANNQLTLTQLKNKLQQEGMDFNTYRNMIHKQLIIHQVEQNAVANRVQVNADDIKNALTQYQSQAGEQQQFHVIDILANSKQQAEKLLVQLKNGADMNTLAPKNTTDLGWQTTNTLPQIFLQQLSHMKSGDIAGPIQAPNGFHVIKLAGVQGQSNQPNKMQLQNMAYQMKFQQAVNTWMKKIRKTAYIKIN